MTRWDAGTSRHRLAAMGVLAALAVPQGALAQDQVLVLQSTTSTANSGFYDAILPQFQAQAGIEVRVVAVGTGQALKNAANCDGDMVLVHARAAEEDFVAKGYGTARYDIMYNDFVILGPQADPAGIEGGSVQQALTRIATSGAVFVSRGDDSGTHQAEMALWRSADLDPAASSGDWYRELGSGMGATLNAAVAMGAYVLSDRATWISFGNPGAHQILVQGAPALFNQYGAIPVSPTHCPKANVAAAQAFTDWLRGPVGQTAIDGFRLAGQQLFFANAQ